MGSPSAERVEATLRPDPPSRVYAEIGSRTRMPQAMGKLTTEEKRLAHGQCPSCGQRLYRMQSYGSSCCCFLWISPMRTANSTSDGSSSHRQRRVPLSIPNLVHRGQCLQCVSKSNEALNPVSPSQTPSRSTTPVQSDDAFGEDACQASNTRCKSIELRPDTFLSGADKPSANYRVSQLTNVQEASRYVTTSRLSDGMALYRGPYNERGEKHGEGEMFWSNGDVYTGSFSCDRRHGHGTLVFGSLTSGQSDGGEYVGEWRDNLMHGSGTRRYPNGDVYMGDYLLGQRQGQGRFFYANGDLYWGSWENNEMHGSGRYYYASGQRFEGTFVHGKRTGKGKLQRIDGAMDIFQYVNDLRVGKGVRWSSDRTRAWMLWAPKTGCLSQGSLSLPLEKKIISIAEAVSTLYEIETAAENVGDIMGAT